MAEVIGRVTRGISDKRGPDSTHRITVPEAWLALGCAISLELPARLTCATCAGGGCDACGRGGATRLRENHEPPEVIQVVLPARGEHAKDGGVVLRIPGHGGRADDPSTERGLLLLKVEVGADPDPSVHAIERENPASLDGNPTLTAAATRFVIALALVLVMWLAAALVLR